MITNPEDPRVWQALSRLQYNDDWNTVREWLETERQGLQDRNDSQLEDVLLRRGQGGSLMLRELFRVMDESTEAIKRMEAQRTP